MKLIFFILSVYVVLLSAFPCGDEYSLLVHFQNDTRAELTHEHETNDEEHCPPFCICNCCAITIDSKVSCTIYKDAPVAFTNELKFTIRNTTFSSAYYGNIWQPPKI